MLLDLPQLSTVVEIAALAVAYRLPRSNESSLITRHHRIWMRTEKVDSRFTKLKDYIVPRYTFD